jgi:hypothetical protein
MTLTDVMKAIEQDEFSAEMNLAAGTRAFRRSVSGHDLFLRLTKLAKENPSEVAERIESISRLDVDVAYENRLDAALSAYLMVLSDVAEPEVVAKAGQAVLRTPKCWWAAGLARELLLETVATGAIGAGVDWHEAIHARFAEWFNQIRIPSNDNLTKKWLLALSAGQPSGQGNKVIDLPSQEKRASIYQHSVSKVNGRKRSARPYSITNARVRKHA